MCRSGSNSYPPNAMPSVARQRNCSDKSTSPRVSPRESTTRITFSRRRSPIRIPHSSRPAWALWMSSLLQRRPPTRQPMNRPIPTPWPPRPISFRVYTQRSRPSAHGVPGRCSRQPHLYHRHQLPSSTIRPSTGRRKISGSVETPARRDLLSGFIRIWLRGA